MVRLFLLVPLTAAALAVEASVPHKIKESIQGPPHGWISHGPAPSDHVLELKIALPRPHFPILEQHLWQVSDPDHERYGAYLSKEETEALMAPHPESLDVVGEWLSSHGIQRQHLYWSTAQDWVTVRVPIGLAEDMLGTKYHVYTHLDSGESIVRTTSYSLPESLHEHIELVQPTTMFSRLKPLKSILHRTNTSLSCPSVPSSGVVIGPAGNQVNANCNCSVTLRCLRQLYNAVGYNTSSTNGNEIAVTAYEREYANNQDLQQFFQFENPAAYGSNYTFVSINGGLNNQTYQSAGLEADLDTQFAFGLTYPTRATLYSTGGSPPFIPDSETPTNTNEPYIDWLEYVSSQEFLPQTISTSYCDDEQTVPYSYATRVCAGFAALAARGVSVIFGSGDGGVGGSSIVVTTNQTCTTNNGTNKTMFIPQFPASCPYVTAVGATMSIPEIPTNFTGGGFSNYFRRPNYQEKAASSYLKKLAPGTYEGLYNSTGRGIPDVAAQGWLFAMIYQGQPVLAAGTSCSAPTFASFISMLSDARLSAGKPPMGFLNPWLYKTGFAGLNDITTGHNAGCGTEGFNATDGWDPVTGLGTPNFEKLLMLAMKY